MVQYLHARFPHGASVPVTCRAAERDAYISTHTALMATSGTGGCAAVALGHLGASWPLPVICLKGSYGAALDSVSWPLV